MSASNLGNDYINEENSPIPIPPAKDGWADMERRLNATPPRVRLPLLQKAAIIAGMAVISGIAFAITYHAIYHSPISSSPIHSPKQDTPSAGALAGENILLADSIQAGYFSLNKYLPAPAGITGADKLHRVTPLVIPTGNARDEAGVNTKHGENDAHSGMETNAHNETRGSNPAIAAPEAGAPATAHSEGSTGAHPVKGTNVNARTNANPAVHPVGAGTNTTRANANTTAHNAGAGTKITRAKINAIAQYTANPTPPDTATAANLKSVAKKTNTGAVAKGRAGNVFSATTTDPTSPEINSIAAPATMPAKEDIGGSFHPPLLLQSLPLTRINHTALTQRTPQSIPSRINKIRQRDLPEWQLLLQWQVPVPLSGSAYYLSGPNGNNQLYRPLIPGIRMVRKWNAQSISLDLMPFTAQTYNDPVIRESSAQSADSTTTKTKLTLHKEFGASGAILYHRRIFKQWQVAAGIQLNYWLTQSGDLQTLRYPSWGGNVIDSSNSSLKESIQRPQLKIPLEVYYDAPRWQAGLRVDIPLNINRSDSIKTPFQLQLMLRYKLLPRRK